jgi:hypothetical protein
MSDEKQRKSAAILAELEGLNRVTDKEEAHVRADDLLIELLTLLRTPKTKELIEGVIAAYNQIGKWYA